MTGIQEFKNAEECLYFGLLGFLNSKTPMAYVLAVTTLWRREIVRFLRQRNRIVGALGTPLVFWLLIGSGLGSSFRSSGGGERYLEYSFPGTLALIVLFT